MVAHEFAHMVLHPVSGRDIAEFSPDDDEGDDWDDQRENEADRLIEKWGFRVTCGKLRNQQWPTAISVV